MIASKQNVTTWLQSSLATNYDVISSYRHAVFKKKGWRGSKMFVVLTLHPSNYTQ